MITVKLKNVSVKSGQKYRKNQNYTMTFFKSDGINDDSDEDDIKNLIISNYSDIVKLNLSSEIEIIKKT